MCSCLCVHRFAKFALIAKKLSARSPTTSYTELFVQTIKLCIHHVNNRYYDEEIAACDDDNRWGWIYNELIWCTWCWCITTKGKWERRNRTGEEVREAKAPSTRDTIFEYPLSIPIGNTVSMSFGVSDTSRLSNWLCIYSQTQWTLCDRAKPLKDL